MTSRRLSAAVIFAATIWFIGGAAARTPIDEFGKDVTMAMPVVSPGGTHIAVPQILSQKPAIAIYDLTKPGSEPFIQFMDRIEIAWVQWVNDERIALGLNIEHKVRGLRETYTFGRVFAFNRDGSKPVTLLNNSRNFRFNLDLSSIVDLLPDEPNYVLMPAIGSGSVMNLYKVNVYDGKAQLVVKGTSNTFRFLTDGKGVPRARWEYSERKNIITIAVRKGESDKWEKVVEYGERDIPDIDILGFTGDATTAIVVADKAGDKKAVYEFDIVTKTLGKMLFQHPKVDVGAPVGGGLYDWVTGRIAGVVYAVDGMRAEFFDPQLKQIQAEVDNAFPNATQRVPLNWSRDRMMVIVYTTGPRDSGSYYVLDRRTKKMQMFGGSHDNIPASDLGEMKIANYPARDGTTIPAYLTLPSNGKTKGLPLIVMPHGGPQVRDALDYDWWAQSLASRGYAVLQPNFRGSGGYGRAFAAAGHQQWALRMQDDVTDGVKKLIADGTADPKRVCIVGASYGGYAALAGGAFTPDLYACIVSFAGVSDLPAFLDGRREEFGNDSSIFAHWVRLIGNPSTQRAKIEAASPAKYAANFKAPVLLIHGAKDDNVPIRQSETMEAALKKAGKPVRFVKLPKEGHNLELAESRITLLKETEAFLASSLGGAPSP